MGSKKSNFINDLKKEQLLAQFLDNQYSKYLNHYSFQRISGLKEQREGIDLKLFHEQKKKEYLIDEKAQLDYLNEDLPTFAFEINYLLKGKKKKGWLFDKKKKTDFYALITGIYSDEPGKFTSCKIVFVNRNLLLNYLNENAITVDYLEKITKVSNTTHGKIKIPKLNSREEGYLFLSSKNIVEKPLNLILRLDFLIKTGIAKQLV